MEIDQQDGTVRLASGLVITASLTQEAFRADPASRTVTRMLAYLLAGAEFGFAALSFGGSRLSDPRGLRLIAWSCIVFHASSGILEAYAYARGASAAILANVAARALIVALFAYLA